jgi:23S rRNA (cytosine1962-C5)-methyltransferase
VTTGRSARVILKPRRARPLFARHPWVYVQSVADVVGAPTAGDEVDVVSQEGVFIARGLFNPASKIRVRLYRWSEESLDSVFWRDQLEAAFRLRSELLHLRKESNAYRLVFSEGDGLSGLTVDCFDRWLIAQFSSLALFQRRDVLVDHLMDLSGAEGIIARPDRAVAAEEGLRWQDVETRGTLPAGPITIVENGLSYEVDLGAGQKTGFYFDQRENRRAVAHHCAGKRVLDLCCFTGGFSLCALLLGAAASALGVDSSAPIVARADRNAALNGLDHANFEAGDVLKVLERLTQAGERFEVVVCDPPKFAHRSADLPAALNAYRRLNLAALGVLAPWGILATCSCSGLVSRQIFSEMLGQVAEESGRTIQILEQRGQGPDHPVSASCLESDYLKCVIARVGP